jgi:hypothetical protein
MMNVMIEVMMNVMIDGMMNVIRVLRFRGLMSLSLSLLF